jgi:hypothetical protein
MEDKMRKRKAVFVAMMSMLAGMSMFHTDIHEAHPIHREHRRKERTMFHKH